MDPEIESQLTEQFAMMSELLSKQNSMMAAQAKVMADAISAQKTLSTVSSNASSTDAKLTNSITGNTKKAEATAEANKKITETNGQLAKALGESKTALIGFAGAMLDTTPGLAKYSQSVKGAADALGGATSSFGLLGKAASGLLGVFSSLVSASFNFTDAMVKGYDDIAKAGGAIGTSAEQILEMGHAAGLSSQNLEIFTKHVSGLGSNLRSLGTTTSGGIAAFGKIVAVGDRTLQQYRKVGMSQDELMEAQAKYIDLQAKAGADLKRSPQELQKASLAYVDQLNILAELTGVSVKEQQNALDAALADENYQAYRTHLEMERDKALKEHNTEEVKRLDQKIAAKDALVKHAKATMGAEGATAMLQAVSTDGAVVWTEHTAKLAMSGYNLDKVNDLTNKGESATLELNRQMAQSNKYMYDTYGPLIYSTGDSAKKFQQTFAFEPKTRQTAMRNQELLTNEGFAKAQAREKRIAAQYEARQNAEKGEMARRAALEANERAARKAFDDVLKQLSDKINSAVLNAMPMVTKSLTWLSNNFDMVVSVSKALAIALGALVAAAAVGKVFSAFTALSDATKGIFSKKTKKGKLGTSGNPVYATLDQRSTKPGTESTSAGLPRASSVVSGLAGKTAATAVGALGLNETVSGILADQASEKASGLVDAIGGKVHQRFNRSPTGGIAASGLGEVTNMANSPGGTKVGTFLEGIVQGLAAAGKPPAPLYIAFGAAAIGAAITAIGAGLAGATLIMGKALPSFAAGLKSFDELNGPNLQQVGTGMAGLGAGILALGAGNIADSLSNVVNWFVGGTDPLDEVVKQVKKLEEMTLNTKKVKENSDAVIAFSKAMAAASEIGSSGAMSNAAKGIADSINSYFGGKPPTQQLEDFSKLQIDSKNVRKNAKAFKVFAEAMASYTGFGSPVGAIGSAIAEATTRFFGASPPFTQFVMFSLLPINAAKTKNNATAFKLFSEAMASYKGMGSPIGVIGTAMADAAYKFFNVRPPLEQFVYFSHLDIDPKKTSVNAKSFVAFSNAMAEYKGGPGLIDTISSLVGKGFGALFGEDGPVEAFKKFTKEDFGPKASENSEAFYKYAQAAGMVAQAGGGSLPGSGGGGGGSGGGGGGSGGGGGGFSSAVSTGADRGAALGAGAVGAVGGALSSLWESGRSMVTGMSRVSEEDLKKAGLRIKSGDVHGPKYDLDNRIIPLAQKIQQNIPGFKTFTSFNDRFHHGLSYESKHKSGKAVDFALDKKPTDRVGREIVAALKSAGAAHAIDEYNHPSGASTGGHIHAQFAEKGGIFSGHHQGEMISPLNMNSVLSKLAKLPADNVTPVGATHDNTGNVDKSYSRNVKLTEEIGQKLDELVAVLQDNHHIKNKILQHSRA